MYTVVSVVGNRLVTGIYMLLYGRGCRILKCDFHLLLSVYGNLWCYECVSTQPGCSTEFSWWWHWTTVCPEDDDVCVKIVEKKDGELNSRISHK